MDDAGVVDTDNLGILVDRLASIGVASVGVLGSTGSYMYLSSSERERALIAAVEAAGRTPVLAGIGALRTSDVLAGAKAAERAGAAAALLAPVSYLPLTDRDFTQLTASVAQVCGLPICLYNNPGTTHFNMSDALVGALAQIENVAAVKNPAPAGDAAPQVAALRSIVPDDFVVGYSGDAKIDGPLAAGADAWYSVVAGVLPGLALAIWAVRDRPEELAALHGTCAPLWALFNAHGSIRVTPHILEALGHKPAALPLPLLPLERDVVAEVERALALLPVTSDLAA